MRAFATKALGILEVVVDAVEHVEAIGAGRRDRRRQPVEGRPAVGGEIGAGLLDEVVGAQHEASKPGSGCRASCGDLLLD